MIQTCRVVHTDRIPVFYEQKALQRIDAFITGNMLEKEKIFILTDRETSRHCLPVLLEHSRRLKDAMCLQVDGGESSKSIETAIRLWNELSQAGATRNSLLINLGGGVVSDLGGFVASAYHRGIRYINIPTSLIGQVDAAIGGKTGVNLGKVKNQVGTFCNPEAVFIYPGFLTTLPTDHFRSGLAEVIKSALISDPSLWRRISKRPVPELLHSGAADPFFQEIVAKAVSFKVTIVRRDFREKKLRKVLNFGHTIGHALEALFMESSSAIVSGSDAASPEASHVNISRYDDVPRETSPVDNSSFEGTSPEAFPVDGSSLNSATVKSNQSDSPRTQASTERFHRIPKTPLLHGDAVASGMICATMLSGLKCGLPLHEMQLIATYLSTGFPFVTLEQEDTAKVMSLLNYDKKRRNGLTEFTLLEQPGKPVLQIPCGEKEILQVLDEYKALRK